MKPLSLLLLGVVVGWFASGEWSFEATGGDDIADAAEIPPAPVIGPMIEISNSRDVRKVIVPDEAPAVDHYRAITRVQIEELGGRENVEGIIGAHDLKYLTAGLNALAAEGWSLVIIEQAHQYTIAGPAGASITNPATYIFERRHE